MLISEILRPEGIPLCLSRIDLIKNDVLIFPFIIIHEEGEVDRIKNSDPELTPIELYEFSRMNEMDLDEVKKNLYNHY